MLDHETPPIEILIASLLFMLTRYNNKPCDDEDNLLWISRIQKILSKVQTKLQLHDVSTFTLREICQKSGRTRNSPFVAM